MRATFLETSMLSPTFLDPNTGASAEIEFSTALRKGSIVDKSNPESRIALKALTQTRNFSAKQSRADKKQIRQLEKALRRKWSTCRGRSATGVAIQP
jgi:hypothetical protein